MPRYKIIYNPHSNRGSSLKELPQVGDLLCSHQLDFDIVQTQYPWHAARLAEEAVMEGYDVAVAAGGDGTVNEVLNGLMLAKRVKPEHDTCLGILPVGRGNDFAFSMGIPANIEESVATLAVQQRRRIDVGRVCGGLYPEGRFFGNGVGIGFDAVVGFVAAENRYLPSFLTYLWAAIMTIWQYFDAPEIEIRGDDWVEHRRHLMVSIMNGRRMGGTFMMAPDSLADDGLLDLCLVGDLSKLQTMQTIPRFFNGSQYGHPAVSHRRSRTLQIRATEGSLPAHADGETLCTEGEKLDIELQASQIDLIYRPQEERGEV